MKIELTSVSIRELAEGYADNQEDGVVGYGGKLDVRPPTNANLSRRTSSVTPSLTPSSRPTRSTSFTGPSVSMVGLKSSTDSSAPSPSASR